MNLEEDGYDHFSENYTVYLVEVKKMQVEKCCFICASFEETDYPEGWCCDELFHGSIKDGTKMIRRADMDCIGFQVDRKKIRQLKDR